ncbi:1,4-dihydroxy-2-naphthoate prenyltransferase [Robiginitalea myxolifaciens]|uniref:1,4-dihydroxy-2-naphthoate octaprenyltransferase n=1 Tax=Robiginitalea myxolifaciens TaxID=400055 RepID=A0A1I6GTS2_9FLAO|nr:1,4-dihydroxy-2-naphthoate octaprenyltransferase [Robiginitalea myxolifaciens]SFR45644.1 1,4-dihydroxy-2-naphthoate prenyltransferase [Robiginitalea myxolifaciens]
MKKIGLWIRAARLRTLPLSLAGILAGTALAYAAGYQDNLLFLLTLATTLAYQITSNFANDYGDGVKGTDNENRIGPQRVLQSGALQPAEMKRGIIIAAVISGLLTLGTLLRAFSAEDSQLWLVFALLGLFAIWASIKYTVGSDAYGYRGLGDLFVFLFFGLLSVLGTYFLYARAIALDVVWVAVAVGCLSAAVLNLNNMRDINSDRTSGKRTLAVLLGFQKARLYHCALITLAFLAMILHVGASNDSIFAYLPLLPFVILAIHLLKVMRTGRPENLDPELKKVALSTFFIGLLLLLVNRFFL